MSTSPNQPVSPQSADAPDFEQALAQLESIIERIESGQIGLENSIAEYERGVGLIRRCRQVLDRAEQRVEELTSQMQADRPSASPPTIPAGTDARGVLPDSKDRTPF